MQKILWGTLSLVSLAVCLLSAVGYFFGNLQASEYKFVFLAASLGWFVFAAFWAKHRKKT